jgi:hypothetical protein
LATLTVLHILVYFVKKEPNQIKLEINTTFFSATYRLLELKLPYMAVIIHK